mgnify:FL=1
MQIGRCTELLADLDLAGYSEEELPEAEKLEVSNGFITAVSRMQNGVL